MNFYAPKARFHSEEDYQELLSQIQQLQTKLSCKTETLLRLGKDLEAMENENRLWKAKAETYERNLQRAESELLLVAQGDNTERSQAKEERISLERNLQRALVENEQLKRQNTEFRLEIRDLQKDCKTFRQQLAKVEVDKIGSEPIAEEVPSRRSSQRLSSDCVVADKLDKFEKVVAQSKQMEIDLKTLLSLKEELVLEREALVKKVERLSSELGYLLNGDPRRVAEDLDGLVTENRYLKAQLDNAQEESLTIKATLEKYRSIAEHSTSSPQPTQQKSPQKDDSSLEEKSSVAVINMKQIRELLTSNSIELSDGDYRALSNILLDLCNDKQMVLAHQRRANKILGNRLHDVEQKLLAMEASKSPRSLSPRPNN